MFFSQQKSEVPIRASGNKLCLLRPRLGTGTLNFLPTTLLWPCRFLAMSKVNRADKYPLLIGMWKGGNDYLEY